MNMPRMIRFAGCSTAVALATALGTMTANAQESIWNKAATQATGPLTQNLARAFPSLKTDADSTADFTKFVTTLKATGLGKASESPAPASEGGRSAGAAVAAELFKQLDADRDGTVLVKDLPPAMAELARKSRPAADAKLTLAELEPLVVESRRREVGEGSGGRPRPAAGAADIEFITAIDANHDGKVTMAELRGAIETSLKKALDSKATIDTNQDGKISKKEYAITMPKKFGEIDEHGMDGHARAHFKADDRDGNDELSFEEIVNPIIARQTARVRTIQLAVRLASANTDGDSILTTQELETRVGSAPDTTQSPWTALPFKNGGIALDSIYGALSRMPEKDALELDRILR